MLAQLLQVEREEGEREAVVVEYVRACFRTKGGGGRVGRVAVILMQVAAVVGVVCTPWLRFSKPGEDWRRNIFIRMFQLYPVGIV